MPKAKVDYHAHHAELAHASDADVAAFLAWKPGAAPLALPWLSEPHPRRANAHYVDDHLGIAFRVTPRWAAEAWSLAEDEDEYREALASIAVRQYFLWQAARVATCPHEGVDELHVGSVHMVPVLDVFNLAPGRFGSLAASPLIQRHHYAFVAYWQEDDEELVAFMGWLDGQSLSRQPLRLSGPPERTLAHVTYMSLHDPASFPVERGTPPATPLFSCEKDATLEESRTPAPVATTGPR